MDTTQKNNDKVATKASCPIKKCNGEGNTLRGSSSGHHVANYCPLNPEAFRHTQKVTKRSTFDNSAEKTPVLN